MSVFIASLNSGSNGNCYYVGNHNEAVLIDAGIPCREIEKRMMRAGLEMSRVKAIFISHEHTDHIRGVAVTAKKYHLPVYATSGTLKRSRFGLDSAYVRYFKAYEPVQVGGLSVLPFPKLHDAADPHSFTVQHNEIKIGVLTDIGHACDHVIKNFSECHAAFLEANYDEEMLETGRYPYHLKVRIKSEHGHLSNDQALELFVKHRPEFMSHVLLSHLSKENNSPDVAHKLFQKHAGNTNVVVASRYEESAVYEITHRLVNPPKHKHRDALATQMTLF